MSVHRRSQLPRREFMGRVAGGVAAAALASCAHTGPRQARRRPNVIYAFSDEHRAQSMSFTEMPELETPHMAALAAQGATFTHCISNYPVCSPHRAILMTGRWPYQQGVIDNNIPLGADETTLAKAFKAEGYDTAYIGKWHLGGTRAEPFGFDLSLIWSRTNAHWDRSRYHPRDGAPVQPKGYNATLMTDQAIEYIDDHQRQRPDTPFFLMLSWNPPHSDFLDPPEAKKALYPEGSLPWRENVDLDARKEKGARGRIWDQNSWPYYQGYHAHISAIDDELGRLMARLQALGIAEDTILVYSADHGSMMGSHGLGSKRQPYEESIRVPFSIRWPGVIPAGLASDALLGSIDLMPTLCGLAGVPAPATCAGRDFSPVVLGGKGPDPEAQFIMHISKKNASGGDTHPAPIFRGVRTRRHTYAVYPDERWCLFDNEQDPCQLDNRIADPAMAEVRERLEGMLRRFLREAEDPLPVPG